MYINKQKKMVLLCDIRQRLDLILEFLQPHWDLLNCHMVNFFTHNLWDNYMPLELQREIRDVADVKSCFEIIYSTDSNLGAHRFPEFKSFFENNKKFTLSNFDNVLTDLDEFYSIAGLKKDIKQKNLLKSFYPIKKHEVDITARLLHDLLSVEPEQNDVFIVDAGSGKGYLSSCLALEYNYKVLGIDFNDINTINAEKRYHKLQRAWKSLKAKSDCPIDNVIQPQYKEKLTNVKIPLETTSHDYCNYYKTVSRNVTRKLSLIDLVRDHFSEFTTSISKASICLTGLHTCGNLSPTCLNIFNYQRECKFLLNIGCCYHLIKEEYSGIENFKNINIMNSLDEPGFPMSQYLRSKRFQLKRNARMLATQSLERFIYLKKMPNSSLFYRALLQVLISNDVGKLELEDNIQIGKIYRINNFTEYVMKCMEKYPSLSIDTTKLPIVENDYSNKIRYLQLFYLLRMSFAPIIESIILLDRLLFLHEMGHTNSYLIPLFNAIISPRRFAIIAIKQ